MSTVISIVLGVIAVIYAIKHFFSKVAAQAFVLFIVKKGYTPPTAEELRACAREVIRQKFSKDA